MDTATGLADRYAAKRVLVTGGLGFIGSNLARALVRLGCDVTVVDSLESGCGGDIANLAGLQDRLRVSLSDIGDPASLRELVADREIVFNLAARTSHVQSLRDPLADLETNCRAQLSLLETCRQHTPSTRIVFASTRQIYGRPQYLPVDELHPVSPVDPNGIHKQAAESYHLLYGRLHGLEVSILRLTNTYGPRMWIGDGRQNFVGLWLRIASEGGVLDVFGDGSQRRDLTYVDDVVNAFLLAGVREQAIGEIFNVGGESVTLLALASALTDASGCGSHRLVAFPEERRSIDIGDCVVDDARIRERLGWEPAVDLQKGLTLSARYLRERAAEVLAQR